MLIWLVAQDGTFVDELDMASAPQVGDTVSSGRAYKVIETPEQDENAKKFNAHVAVVSEG